MFFNSISTAIIIRRQYLELYTSTQGFKVAIPESAFANLEVLDKKELEKTVVLLLEQAHLKPQKIVLLAADDTLFRHQFSVVDVAENAKAVADYTQSVPIEKKCQTLLELHKQLESFVYIGNCELYQALHHALEQKEWTPVGVAPLSLLVEDGSTINQEQLKIIFRSIATVVKKYPLYNQQAYAKKNNEAKENIPEKNEQQSRPVKQAILLFVAVLLFLGAGVGIAYSLGFISSTVLDNLPFVGVISDKDVEEQQDDLQRELVVETITETPVEQTLQEEVFATVLAKSELSIEVYNGSGVAGQAGEVKELLESLGYSVATTGNVAVSAATSSSIIYSDRVPEENKVEIDAALLEFLGELTSSQQTATASSDIVITTSR